MLIVALALLPGLVAAVFAVCVSIVSLAFYLGSRLSAPPESRRQISFEWGHGE